MIIPKAVPDRHGWSAGVELDEQGDLVVLRRDEEFRPTRFAHVYGCLKHGRRPLTVAALDEAVLREAASEAVATFDRRLQHKAGCVGTMAVIAS